MDRSHAGLCVSILFAILALPAAPRIGATPPDASPPPAASLPDGVLAVVGDGTISVTAFTTEMARRGGGLPGQYATPEQRRALLDEMVEFRALAALARREGLDRDPDLVAAFERLLVTRYREKTLKPELDRVTVLDGEVQSFYEQHKQEYAVPERIRAAIVQVRVPPKASEEQWAAAEAKARQALEEAGKLDPATHHFGPVAVRYSDDRASRYQGGVIGWLTRGATHEAKWAPEVVEAAWALQSPGDLAPIVRASDGVYLVRLVDREESKARSFDVLQAGFRNQILRDKQERVYRAFVERTLSAVGARVDTARLDSIPPPETSIVEKRPPALPTH